MFFPVKQSSIEKKQNEFVENSEPVGASVLNTFAPTASFYNSFRLAQDILFCYLNM
jgi:hypothetical protein